MVDGLQLLLVCHLLERERDRWSGGSNQWSDSKRT
jgi:hypothetical protein